MAMKRKLLICALVTAAWLVVALVQLSPGLDSGTAGLATFGRSYGYVNANFCGVHDCYTLHFSGETEPRWRWGGRTHYKYSQLTLEWSRNNDEHGSAILLLPSMEYRSGKSSGILTRETLTSWLLSNEGKPDDSRCDIETILGYLQDAGAGCLPSPSHHGYHFEPQVGSQIGGNVQHFSLGTHIPYTLAAWLLIGLFLLLAATALRRVALIFGVLAVVATIVGTTLWLTRWESFDISGSAIASRQCQQVYTSGKGVYRLDVAVSGYMDGGATITIRESGKPWRSITIGPGNVSERVGGDFYDSQAEVIYVPQNAKTGQLTIKYNFSNL